MTRRPVFFLLTLLSLYACGEVSRIGSGLDSEGGRTDGGDDESGLANAGASSAEPGDSPKGGGGGLAGAVSSMGRAGSNARGGAGSSPSNASGAGGRYDGSRAGSANGGRFGMQPSPDTSDCGFATLETNQGTEPPSSDACSQRGAELKNAHDDALRSKVLDVAPLAGTWVDGSGAERVELVLDATGAGTLRFGDASDFTDASDPTEPFITNVGEREADKVGEYDFSRKVPGFAYSIIAENGRGSEMTFHVLTLEPWETWCSLQTPVHAPGSRDCYACEYDGGQFTILQACGAETGCYATLGVMDEAARVHCGRFELCLSPYSRVCSCTEDQCFANFQQLNQITVAPYRVTIDPIDTTVLRLVSTSERDGSPTRYLVRED